MASASELYNNIASPENDMDLYYMEHSGLAAGGNVAGPSGTLPVKCSIASIGGLLFYSCKAIFITCLYQYRWRCLSMMHAVPKIYAAVMSYRSLSEFLTTQEATKTRWRL